MGVARPWVYIPLEDAKTDPEAKLEEAEKEAEFRRWIVSA